MPKFRAKYTEKRSEDFPESLIIRGATLPFGEWVEVTEHQWQKCRLLMPMVQAECIADEVAAPVPQAEKQEPTEKPQEVQHEKPRRPYVSSRAVVASAIKGKGE